jgi:hypothetical protein
LLTMDTERDPSIRCRIGGDLQRPGGGDR